MALSKLSEIGGRVIQGNWDDETIFTAIADGAAKAGHVICVLATGVIDGTDATNDSISGILLPHHKFDVDAAPTATTTIVSYVVPQAGHLYGILCGDPGTHAMGWGMVISANAGLLASCADVLTENPVCRTFKYTTGDTAIIVVWGGS